MPDKTPPIFNEAAIKGSTRGIVVATSDRSAAMLAAHEVAATFFPNAEAIQRGHDKLFANRAVYIAPDEKGDDLATALAWRLHGIASEVRIVHPPDLHGTVEQWLVNGGSKQRLVEYIKESPTFSPTRDNHPAHNPPDDDDTGWRTQLITDDHGKVKPGVHNAQLFLAYHGDTRGVLAYNRFAHSVDIMRRPPWENEPSRYPRPLSDVDDTRMTAWLERHGCKLAINTVHNAAISAAHHAPYNPLQEYLGDIQHDGKPRLDRALADYFGADNNEYTQLAGARFMIGAVARALDPGCIMRTMLILEGPQDIQKSTAVRELFGPEFFSDELADITSKDSSMQMQGVWCIEIADLATMYRAETNHLKAFLSRRVDRYRPPYGRNVIQAARQCVFVGTVNPEGGYLKDATGGTRFWPVMCRDIDLKLITRERDQIWAEAVARYRQGERWWFTPDEWHIAAEEQAQRYESDPWHDEVLRHAGYHAEVTIPGVLDALDVPKHQQDNVKQARVARILRSAGYGRRQRGSGDDRRWVYLRESGGD